MGLILGILTKAEAEPKFKFAPEPELGFDAGSEFLMSLFSFVIPFSTSVHISRIIFYPWMKYYFRHIFTSPLPTVWDKFDRIWM